MSKAFKKPAVFTATLDKKTIVWTAAAILLVGMAIYLNAFAGAFVWDDESLVLENPFIRSLNHVPQLLAAPIGAGIGRKDSYYRPLQMVTYAADYGIWKLNPLGFHLSSVAFHLAASLAVWWLVFLLFGDNLMALLAGLLFVAHPVHTEAVAYVAGRADPLVLLFSALTCIFYVRRFSKRDGAGFVLMLASFVLALLSRENSLVLPVLLLLCHYVRRVRFRPGDWFSLVAVAAVYVFVRATYLSSTLSPMTGHPPLAARLTGFFVALERYVRLLFVPYPLHMEYLNPTFNFFSLESLAGFALLCSGAWFIATRRGTDRLPVFSMSWFLLALLPFANIYPIKTFMAEHWLYMPSIGFFILVSRWFVLWYRRPQGKRWALAVFAALMVCYSAMTVRQNALWSGAFGLFSWTLRWSPESLQAHVNLGLEYARRGDKKKAKAFYVKAIELAPGCAEAHNNLANILLEEGKFDEAIRHYQRAIEAQPLYSQAHYNLANVYKAIGRTSEALTWYKKAIELNPDLAGAYNNLGVEYYKIGQKEQAIELFRKVLEVRPDYTGAYNNLANMYKEMGRYDEAIQLYQKTLEMDPRFIMAYYNLGLVYQAKDRPQDAVEMFQKALRLNPGYADAHNSLAESYIRLKEYGPAIQEADRAKSLGHANPALLAALEPFRK